VAALINGELTSGFHEVNFNAAHLPSGNYIYRLSSGGKTEVRKMVLSK